MSLSRIAGLPFFRTPAEAKAALGCRTTRRAILLAEYQQRYGQRVRELWETSLAKKRGEITAPATPLGFYGRHLQGIFHGCIVFQTAVSDPKYLGLVFNRDRRVIPQELLKDRQPDFQ